MRLRGFENLVAQIFPRWNPLTSWMRQIEDPAVRNRPTSDIIVNITTSDQIMDDAISAADANRSFSSLLRRVREGRSVVVTSHGKPIARIVPLGERDDRTAEGARAALLARLRAEPVVNVGRWMRHELYED